MSVVSNNILAGASGQGGAGYEIERSLRFNLGDNPSLTRSISGTIITYTVSMWVKRANMGSGYQFLWDSGARLFGFISDNLTIYNGSHNATTSIYRDPSAWMHLVLSVSNGTATLYVNNVSVKTGISGMSVTGTAYIGAYSAGGYNFNGYLADVHLIDGHALAPTDFGETDVNGVWQPKKYSGTYANGPVYSNNTDPSLTAADGVIGMFDGSLTTRGGAPSTNTAYVTILDGESISASTGIRIYWNGVGPGQRYIRINGSTVLDDGSAQLTPGWSTQSSFSGTINKLEVQVSGGGSWSFSAIEVDGSILQEATVGRNSFHLPFSDNSSNAALGTDTSGNGNNFTVNNLSVAAGAGNDSLVDSPTNGTQTDTGAGNEVVGNYATWHPLDKGSAITLTNGNLDIAQSGSGFCKATIAVSSGKWFWEISKTDAIDSIVGIALASTKADANYLGSATGTAGFTTGTGSPLASSPFSQGGSGTIGAMVNGSTIGFALDCDNGTLKLYLNGVLLTANHFTFSPGLLITPALGTNVAAGAYPTNFGQRAFAYTAPSGYKSLNTANLPDPTIADGSKYFDTKLYTGNGASSRTISGLNMSPDFLWVKDRSNTAGDYSHRLMDAVRGAGVSLSSNQTAVERDHSAEAGGGVETFTSDGFTIQQGTSNNNNQNNNNSTYVAWAWDAGSSNTTIASGSLNSSAYDQSVVWSGNNNASTGTVTTETGAYHAAAYDAESLFNPDLSVNGNVYAENAGQWVKWEPASTYTFTNTVQIRATTFAAQIATITYSDNSTSNTTFPSSGGPGYVTIATGGGVIKSIKMQGASNPLNWSYWNQIVIDGKLLVDSGVSVASVPTIASTVRANPSAGFSIVSWTGTANATVAHGLNAAPQLVITKSRQYGVAWRIWSAYLTSPTDRYLAFNDGAEATFSAYWGSMTSTTLGFPSVLDNNYGDMIAYCFAPVAGYSAMGSYTGNGSTDGPFVYTGHRSRFILIKRSDSAADWVIYDTARGTYNPNPNRLYPNLTDAETLASTSNLVVLSNGFQPITNNGTFNTSGATYVYASFASHPFKTARAR